MLTFIKTITTAVLLLLTTSCSSVFMRISEPNTDMVYKGVATDGVIIIYVPILLCEKSSGSACFGKVAVFSPFIIYGIADLPFSFVLDTLLLPVDIYNLKR